MMHPGFRNPKYVGPSGPVDDELSVLSIQALNGDPIGVLANFSMHYHGGGGGPADYFGLFSDRLAKQLAVGEREPVCAMTQGTSGDLHLRDYEGDRTNSDISIYTDGLVEIAKGAVGKVRYDRSPLLGMDQKELTPSRALSSKLGAHSLRPLILNWRTGPRDTFRLLNNTLWEVTPLGRLGPPG
jgi:hypothetical protein